MTAPTSPSPTTVIVIDDDTSIRSSLQVLLSALGHSVLTYAAARYFLDAVTPDMKGCLLLDIRMPDMDGLELLEELRARNILLPVIIMTADVARVSQHRVTAAGSAVVLQKPFSVEHLLQAIQGVVS